MVMIEFTPLAAEKLQGLRAADPANAVLRVAVAGKGCCGYSYSLGFEEAADTTDAVFKSSGIPVAVDPESLPHVQGTTIDFVDALVGGGFTVKNPSQGGGCACGAR